MKKFLILGVGLMFSCLSAMDLPDNFQVVPQEVATGFNDQWQLSEIQCSITAEASQDLAFQTDVSYLETFTHYDASVDLNDICLFYRPVIYEARFPWSNDDLIYKALYPGTNIIVRNIPNSNIQNPDKIPRK